MPHSRQAAGGEALKGKFDAIKYARSLEKQLSAEPAKKKRLHEDLAKFRKRVLEAGKKGLETDHLGAIIEEVQSALEKNDYTKAGQLLAAGAEKLQEELGRFESGTLDEFLESARTIIGEVELLGVDVARAQELWAQAEQQSGKDEAAARRLGASARREAQKARESIISDAVSFPQGLVAESERWGMDVSAYKATLENVKELIKSEDYGRVIELTDSLRENIEKGRRSFFREAVDRAQAGIDGMKEAGSDTGRLEALLSRARSSIDSKDYETAAELLGGMGQAATQEKKIAAGAEPAAKEPSEASRFLQRAQAAIATGAKMGMDTREFTERLEKAAEQLKMRKGSEAAQLARGLLDEMAERQRDLTESVIASLEGDLRSLRKAGARVDSPEAALKEARKAVDEGKYEEAFSLARRALDESEALRETAEAPGAAAPEGAAPAIGRALELVSKAEEDGACLEGVEGLVIAAMERSENGTSAEAEEAAAALERSVQVQTRAFLQADDALQKAQETVADALMQELNISAERQKLAEAISACARGEYESARYQAEDLSPSLRQRCRETIERAVLIATSMVEEFGQSGAEIPKAREYLRRARELSECGRFGLGHSYAMAASEEAKAVGDRFRAAQDARNMMESMLEASREMGVPAGELEAALADVDKLIEARDYDKATGRSVEAIDKLEAHFAERARGLAERFSNLISSAQQARLETASEAAALKEAGEHIKREEYPEAITTMLAPMEALGKRQAMHDEAGAGLQAAGRRLDEAEAHNLETGALRDRLAEAVRRQSEGDFSGGLAISREVAQEAEGLISAKALQLVGELREAMGDFEKGGIMVADLRERVEALPASASAKAFSAVFKDAGAILTEAERRRSRFGESAEGLTKIQTHIEDIKGIGADVSQAEDLLGLARFAAERGSYDDVVDYTRRAETELLNAAHNCLAGFRSRLANRVEEMSRDGVELAAVSRALEETTAAGGEGQFRAVFEGLKRVETDLEVRWDQFRNTQKILAAAEARLTEAGGLGVNTSEAAKLLMAARKSASSGDYPKAVEQAEQSRDTVARNIESHQQTVGALELARAHAREAEAMGADVARALELLEQAASGLAARSYDDAMVRIVECEQELVRSQETLVRDTANLASAALDEAATIGAQTDRAKELLTSAEMAEQAREFDSAFKLARESYEIARQSRDRHSAALGALSEVQKMVQGAHSDGVRVQELIHDLEEARDALQRFEYVSCAEIAERCRRLAEELIAAASGARGELERCAGDMASALDVGAEPGRAGELLEKARGDYSAGDYASARQRAEECHELLMEAQRQAVWEQLGTALLELERLGEEGSDVSGAAPVLEGAGVALAEGDFRGAQRQSRAGSELLREARRAFEEVRSTILTGHWTIEEARFLEADVMVASSLTAGAADALSSGNYPGARDLAVQATDEALRSQRVMLAQMAAAAEKVISESEGGGIKCRLPRDRLARAKAALELGDFKGASDLLEECDGALSRVIHDHKKVTEKMSTTVEAIMKAGTLGMDVSSARASAASAEAMMGQGDYGAALAAYEELLRRLGVEERELVAGRISDMEKQLGQGRAMGMNAECETEALKRARELLDTDAPGAFESAQVAWREFEAKRKEFKRLGGLAASLQEDIGRTRTFGVDVSEAESALSAVSEKLAADAFTEAEEVLKKCSALINERLAGSMAERLENVGLQIKAREDEGIKAPRALELLKEADRLFRSKEYSDMLRKLEECESELQSQEKGRRDMASGVEEMVRLLAGMEALGADTSRPYALASRAKELSAEGDYRQGLNLLEEARAAVETAEKTRVQELLSAAGSALDESEALGADTRQARRLLADAKKSCEAGDRRATAELARNAMEEAEHRTAEHRKHLELLAGVERSIAEGEQNGLSMERARRGLDEARRSLLKFDYPACIEGIERIQREVQMLLRQSSEARRLIAFCEKKIDSARKIGAEVGSAELLLGEAKAATEKRIFVKAFDLATRCLKDLDSMQHAVVLGFLTDTEAQLAELEQSGADLAEAAEMIEVAMEGLNENEFEKAMELGRQALELARVRRSQHESSSETLKELERKMKDASEVGGDVREIERLLERARRALAAHDHDKVGALVRDGLEALIAALQKLVSESTHEASGIISQVEEMGANVAKARDRIVRARRALECFDHKSALNLIEEAVRGAEESRQRHLEITEEMRGLQTMAREASELGLDVSRARKALVEVEDAIENGLYREAQHLIEGARSELDKGYLKQAEEALARSGEALKRSRQLGATVQAEEKLLTEAKVTFSSGRYQNVLKNCKECQRRIDERVNEHIAEVILAAENLLSEAAKIGVDARDFKSELERSEEAVGEGSYEQALRKANEVIEKVRGLLRSSISGTIATLGGLIDESRKIGADVKEVEDFSRMALSALDRGEYEVAHDHALSGIASVDRIREEFIVKKMSEVDQKIREAEELGAVVEDLRRSVEKVRELLEKADFEKAAALLVEAEDNTHKRQVRLAEDSIKRAEEVLSKVKMDIDLSKARSLLEEAKGALEEGEHEEAVDCAGQSIEEAGRVQAQFVGEVISATEETIQAASEMGADTKKSAELLEWARSEQQSGNYDGALEKSVQSAEEAERAQYDFVRGPIEYIRKVMREAKVGDDRIKRLVASAEQLLEKKEYAQARREVLRGLELTGAIQEKQARKHIFDAEEVLAEVEKAGARSTLARNFIGSALKALDAKDFEHAQSYAGECSTQAQKTFSEFQAAQKALKAAEAEAKTLRDVSLAPEEVGDLLELAQTDFSGGEYTKSRDFAQKAVEMAEQVYVKAAEEALSSSQFKINYAKNIGADVSEAEGILKQAKAAHEAKDYRKAIELARRCREEAELAKERYKELVDTIYSAESKISVAHTYGLDTSAAEKLLAQAVANKSRNGEEALDFARQSMEEVQRALERFAPDIKVDIKLEGILQKEKWSQASLTITNSGKATAKDVWVRFSGDLEIQGSEKVPILRMGESRKQAVRVRPSKGGDLPLGTSAVCLREFDSREFKSQETRWIRVEDVTPLATPLNQFVTKSVRCHICLGTIKSGLPLVRCECGKTYHETCSSRVGECPNCGRDLRNLARPQER
jgi:hypothetical protein